MNDAFLNKKLEVRKEQNAFRQLRLPEGKIDFCSNDYLGIVTNNLLLHAPGFKYGSTGSRLLAGNSLLAEETEKLIATFHNAAAGLLFNSGYDANTGVLSCIPQRGDVILYDYLSHASIRDGIRLSFAQSFSFLHNDVIDLEKKLAGINRVPGTNIFIVTESVFSMDGDFAPLKEIVMLCKKYDALLIIDEAHATGVVGEKGEGLVQQYHFENECLARIHTFGKAVGCHGAIVLGSEQLRNYLINFSRPFIYTTALPEAAIQIIRESYSVFPQLHQERAHLQQLIAQLQQTPLPFDLLPSETPIQGIVIPGNAHVKKITERLQQHNVDARPILYPTVAEGKERIRIILHAFNSVKELQQLIHLLSN